MKRHKKIIFPNGHASLVESLFGQSMHSRIGPEREADLLYIQQLEIEKKLKATDARSGNDPCVYYDVGMGTAANAIAALNLANQLEKEGSLRRKLQVISFENDLDGIQTALDHLDDFSFLKPWSSVIEKLLVKREVSESTWSWKWIEGSFYDQLQSQPKPDVIAFDFYDPKVFPDLWSLQAFQKLRAFIGDHPTLLSTYSAATPVRIGLVLAGFFVGSGMTTGAKAETTLASNRMDWIEKPLDQAWIEKLKRSSKAVPYQLDSSLVDERLNDPAWVFQECEKRINEFRK